MKTYNCNEQTKPLEKFTYEQACKIEGIYRLAHRTCTARLIVIRSQSSGDYVAFYKAEDNSVEVPASIRQVNFIKTNERLILEIRE